MLHSYWRSRDGSMRSSVQSGNGKTGKMNSRMPIRSKIGKNGKEGGNPQNLKKHQLNHLRHRLNTFVKDQNLKQLFGKEDMYLDQKFKEIQVFDEKKELHETLKDLKGKHDSLKEQCVKKERQIIRMQDMIKQIKTEDETLKKEEVDLGQAVDDSETRLREIETRLLQAHAKKKTYEHMYDRMKKDELKYKINSNAVERQLKVGSKRLQRNVENMIISKREDKETKHALHLVQSKIEEESVVREKNMLEMKKTIHKRRLLEKKRVDRLKRQKEVAENAATESKDLNEKKWRRLLMVHKFLAFFLKRKMDRELKRFEVVEDAFKQIKSNTGISDPNEIIRKYIGREEIYGQLLISIANSERTLEELKQKHEVICNDKKQLQQELMRLEKPPVDQRREQHKEESEDIKKIRKLTVKLTKLKLDKQTTINWMERLYEKLIQSEIVPTSVDYKKFIEEGKLKEGLELMFGCLRDYYDRLDEEEVREVLIEIIKSGKDLKHAQDKYKKRMEAMQARGESPPHSMSSGLQSPMSSKGSRQFKN